MQHKSKILLLFILFYSNQILGSNLEHKLDSLINNFPTNDSLLAKVKLEVDSILADALKSGDNQFKSKAFLAHGKYYYQIRKYSESLNDFKMAYGFLTKNSNSNLRADIEYNIAKAYNHLNKRNSAIKFFKKSASDYKKAGNMNKYGLQLNNTGLMFWISTQYDSAIVYYLKALEVRKQIGDEDQLATTLNSMGTIYYQWGAYSSAFEYYLQALDYAKRLKNNMAISLYLSNIGMLYKDMGNIPAAKRYFSEAIKYAQTSNHTEALAYAYNSLADLYVESDPDSAIDYFNTSLSKYSQLDFINGQVIAYIGLGKAYLNKGELDKANKYFRIVLEESKRSNIILRVAQAYKYLGIIAEKRGDYSNAEIYFNRCILLSKERRLKKHLKEAYKLLAQLKYKQGIYRRAYEEFRNYLTIRDEIEKDIEGQKFSDLETRLKFEEYTNKLERERLLGEKRQQYINSMIIFIAVILVFIIVLFRLNNKLRHTNKELREKNKLIEEQTVLLKKKNEELDYLNKDKEKLFSIIAHDLKNPFFGLINYSDILLNNIDSFTKEEIFEISKNINSLTKNTYRLLENLLSLSMMQTGKTKYTPEEFILNPIIEEVLALYKQQIEDKEITITLNSSNKHKIFADKKMISLVMRNLIHNAIKFVKKSGTITITIFENKDKVCTAIKDNGIGMDKERLAELFTSPGIKSTRGTEGEKGTGLGLLLVKEFIQINKGEIKADSEPGLGSKFTVCLPKSISDK